jgi:hypothetical protein
MTAGRALVTSTVGGEDEAAVLMGSASYSYSYVYRAFAPLLRRWGRVLETVRPKEHLDDVVSGALAESSEVLHVGFLPLDAFHCTSLVPNVAFPFWDFPDLPTSPLGGNPRNDWARTANEVDLILTSSEFTRDSFARAGVRTPICVVPVPVRQTWLAVPRNAPDERVLIGCSYYTLAPSSRSVPKRSRGRSIYHRHVRPRLPLRSADRMSAAAHAVAAVRAEWRDVRGVDVAVSDQLDLSGIVYTTVFNPFDQRKNWTDLLTAYLIALAHCDDATLVLKLVLPPDREALGVNKVVRFYRQLALAHRCRVVIVSSYLTDDQLLELARATTWYLNSSRAEGACLPLQDFMAAARPAIAPRHSAIADYFTDAAGFVVESHPEPASWPQDPEGRCTTTWHRLVWDSLRAAVHESYLVAKTNRARYEALAEGARGSMTARAAEEVVWPRLAAALDSVSHAL